MAEEFWVWLLVVVLTLGVVCYAGWTGVQIVKTSDWPQVTAKAETVGHGGRGGVYLDLTYTVEGHEYSWTGLSSQNGKAIGRDGELGIRYNPDDPGDVYIVPWWPHLVLMGVGSVGFPAASVALWRDRIRG